MRTLILLTSMALIAAGTDDVENPGITGSSAAFRESAASSIRTLSQAGFEDRLRTPGLGSVSDNNVAMLVRDIKRATPLHDVSKGEQSIGYDVILQPGHYGKTHGATGTTGQFISEQELAAYLAEIIADNLRSSGNSVLIVSAENYIRPTPRKEPFDGLRAKVFLAIHADASLKPCKSGPSLAYQNNSSLLAMHAVGLSLASALGYDYSDFMRDNFTVNEHGYYMFSQIRAERLTGLLEVGELTCPEIERRLIISSETLGLNLAQALNYITQMKRANEPQKSIH